MNTRLDEATITPEIATATRRAHALASASRLTVLDYLTHDNTREASVSDIVKLTKLTQPTVSHHMRILLNVDLVTRERRGVFVWYAATEVAFSALRMLGVGE